MMKILFMLMMLMLSTPANAIILPNYVDSGGNPVHTRDEVDAQVATTVQHISQGYRYTYTLTSMQTSKENLPVFAVYLPDPYSSVIPGFEGSPWLNSKGSFPNDPTDLPPTGFTYTPVITRIIWVALYPQFEIQPGGTATGFTFVSPYPPGIAEGYIEGWAYAPVTPEDTPPPPEFYQRSKYGEGKVIPVIGPVKPVTPNVTDNYSVVGCLAGICDVQLDITGPQDPYGTVYTYQWTGAFGSAMGAKPMVQLAAGAYQVSVAVSDPYATLVTATMPITVFNPNPAAVITPAQAAALTPVQLANLTPAQVASVIAALSPTQIAMLTPVQLGALTPVQVSISLAAFNPAQIATLSPAQLGVLTPAQVGAITPHLTPSQLAALPQAQANYPSGDEVYDDSEEDKDDSSKASSDESDDES